MSISSTCDWNINTLPLPEAQASSEIKDIVTKVDNIFRFAGDDGSADPATREALRYCAICWTTGRSSCTKKLQSIRSFGWQLRNSARKIYSRELLDVIFEQPYCRIENLVNADIAKRETASKYLKQLASLGMMEGWARGIVHQSPIVACADRELIRTALTECRYAVTN